MTAAAQAAASKLAADTVILDVEKVLGITDAFVVTSGTNRRQVLTIAEEVETQVKAAGGPAPLRTARTLSCTVRRSPSLRFQVASTSSYWRSV